MNKINTNCVEDYYCENKGKNLSLKKVAKILNIKFKKSIYLVNKSNLLTQVNPIEVGSGKKKLLVFRFD